MSTTRVIMFLSNPLERLFSLSRAEVEIDGSPFLGTVILWQWRHSVPHVAMVGHLIHTKRRREGDLSPFAGGQ